MTLQSFFLGQYRYLHMAQRTAACQCAQENPPEDPHEGAHEDGNDVSTYSWPEEDMDENVDSSFSPLLSPQAGQGALISSLLNCRYSKTLPHFLHLNSYIGICSSP